MDRSAAAGRRYRFGRPTFRIVLQDLRIPADHPGPGDKVPWFDLPTTDGGRFRSADIAARGRPLVLVFGSLTCPITEAAGPGLVDLHRRYGDAVDFVAVNVREAHPGADVQQPQYAESKMRHARALRQHHGFEFQVAVDQLDGIVHRAFGTRPSSAYVIDATGTIVFRAHWSNRLGALEDAVRAVHSGRTPSRGAVGQTVRALMGMAGFADVALQNAGRGAMRDFWLAAPPVAGYLTLSRVWMRLTNRSSANVRLDSRWRHTLRE
ncbi:redoxin domain-containing protein [Nocardioides sp.]|nr:redoxin domain-containing protein [Nocardioides sp.]